MHELIMGKKKRAASSGWTFDPNFAYSGIILSEGNLKAEIPPNGAAVLGTTGHNTGKRYFEVTATRFERGDVAALVGFSNQTTAALAQVWRANTNQVVFYSWGGGMLIYKNDARVSYGFGTSQGAVIGVAMDFNAGTFHFRVNGVSGELKTLSDYVNSIMGPFYPAVGSPATTAQPTSITTINETPLYLPAGYDPW